MRKKIFSYTAVLLSVLCFACSNSKEKISFAEPYDPEVYDFSTWESIEPGIHSGFASIDTSYAKSIPPSGNITESIRIQGWKGERVNSKLLVWSLEPEEDVSIQISDFHNVDHKISKKNITISVIKYVLCGEYPVGCGKRDHEQIAAHLSPDLLSNESSFELGEFQNRPVWIAIDIPAETPAGIYQGRVIRQSKSGTVSHSITLEVINQTLPEPADWAFHLDLWQNPFAVARYHGVKLWSKEHFELLKPLLEKLAGAGQKCITTTLIDQPWRDGAPYDSFGSMIQWSLNKEGAMEYDYAIFDKYVSLAMESGIKEQINCYSMVPITNVFSWYDESTADTVLMEAVPGTEAYEKLWSSFLDDFKQHLKEKGWLDITSLALDERDEEEMKNLFEFLAEKAPEFKISMAGFYYENINPSIYDFCANSRNIDIMTDSIISSRKHAGLKTTYYVACGITKPNNFTFSPPAESCYEGWFAAARGFDGFLRWAYNSWPENPMVDSRYIKWPSGDTYLVYPHALSSVRFERLREGIQDFEKIRILEEKLAENSSENGAWSKEKLKSFFSSFHGKTLNDRSAAEVIQEGKKLIYEISRSLNNNQY